MPSWPDMEHEYPGDSDSAESEPLPYLFQVPTANTSTRNAWKSTEFLHSPAPSFFTDVDDRISVSELPQAKPGITSHHRLWAELDSLQDDVTRAREVHARRGFLGAKQQDVLGQLREMQVGFARVLAVQESGLHLDVYKELWNVEDADLLRARLFSDHSFDLIAENVAASSELLDQLSTLVERPPENN